MSDLILPTLQRIQADIAKLQTDVSTIKTDVSELKTDVGELKVAVHETNARLSAHMDMTETRFMAVEHAILDIGARACSTSTQREDTTKRHDRELAELRERVSRLEAGSEP